MDELMPEHEYATVSDEYRGRHVKLPDNEVATYDIDGPIRVNPQITPRLNLTIVNPWSARVELDIMADRVNIQVY